MIDEVERVSREQGVTQFAEGSDDVPARIRDWRDRLAATASP